jgi:regulator of replication initiation timing
MELNRENIIKALDCFHSRILNSNLAEKVTENEIMAVINALSLINELTEEVENLTTTVKGHSETIENLHFFITAISEDNRKLTEENERLRKALCREDITIVRARASGKSEMQRNLIRIRVDAIKADTVRKMQERLKEYLDDFYNSGEDALLEVRDLIDQIAKEMLEGIE